MLTATFLVILSVNLAISGGVPQFLISTGVGGGYPDTPTISPPTTEIIDLVDEEVSCSNLEDFPVEIFGAVGGNLGSASIICGGSSNDSSSMHESLKQCYKLLKNGGWEEFTTMISARRFAASIVRENTLHVFGGWGESSTEIIHQDGQIFQGTYMPMELGSHAIASLNSTTSIISGGDYDDYDINDLTWYYNHVSQQFKSGPPLIVGRMFHSSGTVIDQETKEKIVAVAGGFNEDSGYLDSTELLIDGEWRQGKSININ